MPVSPIPEGYHTLTPYLIFNRAQKAIDFYKEVFGAEVIMLMDGPNGIVGHAEIKIGNSMIMLADDCPETEAQAPETLSGVNSYMHLYVEDSETMFKRALEKGATEVRPLKTMFYGDRAGTVKDPFGYYWTISTHVEDVSPEEIEKRINEMVAAESKSSS